MTIQDTKKPSPSELLAAATASVARVSLLVVAAATLLVAASRSHGQMLSAEDYFPLTPGYSWCYDLWSSDCTGGPEEYEGRAVVRLDSCDVPIHDIMACDFQDWDADEACSPLQHTSGLYRSLDDRWMRVHRDYEVSGQSFEEYPGGCGRIPASFLIGQTYEDTSDWFGDWSDGSSWTGTHTFTFRAIGFETITVRAGTFDALKIEVTTVECRNSSLQNEVFSYSESTATAWLSFGVGLIKRVVSRHDESTSDGSGPGVPCEPPASPDFVCDETSTGELVEFQACPWDCDGSDDGIVGIDDFLAVLGQWGTAGSCDFDGDLVGITDFLKVLGLWGLCP